jgi:hypothetical protein
MYSIHRNYRNGYCSSVCCTLPANNPKVKAEFCRRYVIGVRVEGDGKYITKVETLVSDQGDWLFNATGTAYWNSKETWNVIPVSERDTREVIQAAGDAYFDRFNNVNVTVPFGARQLLSNLNLPKLTIPRNTLRPS